MSLLNKKREAEGSLSDPFLLDDSGNEEENGEKEGAPSNKRSKLSSIAEDDNTNNNPNNTTPKYSGTRKFHLMLMVEPDEECQAFLKDCERKCSKEVHDFCFQHEGTLHFSLFGPKNLTYQDAMAIHLKPTLSSLPTMNLTGFTNWPKCVALKTSTSLDDLVSCITPSIPSPNNLHLSLYRMRGRQNSSETKRQFDRVRENDRKKAFGKAKGVRIILKVRAVTSTPSIH